MDLKITSKRIDNPLLVELLKKLTDCFNRMNREFYVIGATARDIICSQLVSVVAPRRTRDLDIAIAIPDWSVFDEIKEALIADSFKKSLHQKQRFYYNGYELDVVPFGVEKNDDHIYWPPEETIAMSVKGFGEVLSDALTVSIDGDFTIKMASLHGLFLLKFNAWLDRNTTTNKDAEDISFILSNYFEATRERNVYQEVYDWDDFNEYVAGSYWLAHDLLILLNKEQLIYYKDCIKREVEQGDASRLLNQILEHDRSLSYETAHRAWQTMVAVFEKFMDEEWG